MVLVGTMMWRISAATVPLGVSSTAFTIDATTTGRAVLAASSLVGMCSEPPLCKHGQLHQ